MRRLHNHGGPPRRRYRSPHTEDTSSYASDSGSEASPIYTQAEVAGTWNSRQQKQFRHRHEYDHNRNNDFEQRDSFMENGRTKHKASNIYFSPKSKN